MSLFVAHGLSPAHVSQAPTVGLTLSAQRKVREEGGLQALGDKARTRQGTRWKGESLQPLRVGGAGQVG